MTLIEEFEKRPKRTSRGRADERMKHSARSLAREIANREKHLAAARSEFDEIVHQTRERFDRWLPADPFLLDVLELVEIMDDGTWVWHGLRNNHGTPTVRLRGGKNAETTVVRYLAVALGFIKADDYGALYPTRGSQNVNPADRKLRRADGPLGKNYGPWKASA